MCLYFQMKYEDELYTKNEQIYDFTTNVAAININFIV